MKLFDVPQLEFKKLDSVSNPKSIHGLYPYRGKISPLDAQQILKQFSKDKVLLDPFCGSGTIVYEAQKYGMKTFGVDLNPIAITLSKAKVSSQITKLDIEKELTNILEAAKNLQEVSLMTDSARTFLHEKTAEEIMRVSTFHDEMSDYLKAAYYGAIALTARGCNDYKWTSSTVGKNITPKRYINFYEKFTEKCNKHFFLNENCTPGKIIEGDSRKLSDFIPPKSIDIVFTSPPYFDALDYTAYYAKLIYEIHSKDRNLIKENLIQKVSNYKESMQQVLAEIEKVTTDDALIIFVVGDKKTKNEILSGGNYFADLHFRKPIYIVEREYTGTQSQVFDVLNKTKRKEQIVVWSKKFGIIK